MRPQLVFLGAPGSGKGTQAGKLVSELNYSHVSTGDLLRAEIAKKSALGQRVSAIINEGKLVDDQTVLDLLKANCDVSSKQYIFDGFPRNDVQAQMLDEQILGKVQYKVFYFDIDLDLLANRLTNRRTCSSCGAIFNLLTKPVKKEGVCDICSSPLIQRKDDKPETVEQRLNVFRDTVGPLLDFYGSKGDLVKLDATQSFEEIYKNIVSNL